MKTSAFTLVELMCSMLVMTVLSGLAFEGYTSAAQKSKIANDVSNLRQIGLALQAYQNDNNARMPSDQGGYFIVSAQGIDQNLLNYSGSSFGVWHSPFDSRSVEPGDSSPVSYSINENVLTPTADGAPPDASEGWTGTFAVSVAPLSNLIVAGPSFDAAGQSDDTSWDGDVASKVLTLPYQGQNVLWSDTGIDPAYHLGIPSLFADFHVEIVPIANYQGTVANSAQCVQWDPMMGTLIASADTSQQPNPPVDTSSAGNGGSQQTGSIPNGKGVTKTPLKSEARQDNNRTTGTNEPINWNQ